MGVGRREGGWERERKREEGGERKREEESERGRERHLRGNMRDILKDESLPGGVGEQARREKQKRQICIAAWLS